MIRYLGGLYRGSDLHDHQVSGSHLNYLSTFRPDDHVYCWWNLSVLFKLLLAHVAVLARTKFPCFDMRLCRDALRLSHDRAA